MENPLPITSVPPAGPGSLSSPRTGIALRIVAGWIAMGVVLAGCFGGIVLLYTLYGRYDRLVVYNQPASTTVRVTSAKLQRPSFVVIYLQKEGGWEAVGWSWLLQPGYYQDLVIDIGYQSELDFLTKDNTPGNIEHRNFVARIFEYKGTTQIFDEQIDTPIRDRSGRIYQKRFWWISHGQPLRHFLRRLEDDPITYLWDVMWP